jgi:hypothetical protein
VNNRKNKKRVAENMQQIAENMTNPKDAEIVRAYAAEVAAAGQSRPKKP